MVSTSNSIIIDCCATSRQAFVKVVHHHNIAWSTTNDFLSPTCLWASTKAREQVAYGTMEVLRWVAPRTCNNTMSRNKSKWICSTLDQENNLGQDSSDFVLNLRIPTSQAHTCVNKYQNQTYNPHKFQLFHDTDKVLQWVHISLNI